MARRRLLPSAMAGISPLLARLKMDLPVVQAAMAGAASSPALAASVARAGGLGSLGMRSPRSIGEDFAQARRLAQGGPLALGLLLRFTRRAHVDAVIAARPDAAILMDGFAPDLVRRLKHAGVVVIHKVGSREAALLALRDGADALIAQGVEAGGHVLGCEPVTALLPQVLDAAEGKPVLVAGGIANAQDVARALLSGAAAAVAGSRYLLTHESGVHPAYKARVLGAEHTLLTRLFGVGWALNHRVVPNGATARWCDEEGKIPYWARLVQRSVEPLVRPFAMLRDDHGATTRFTNSLPLYTPAALLPGQQGSGVETTALYAGECVARIHTIEHAFEVTRALGGSETPRPSSPA